MSSKMAVSRLPSLAKQNPSVNKPIWIFRNVCFICCLPFGVSLQIAKQEWQQRRADNPIKEERKTSTPRCTVWEGIDETSQPSRIRGTSTAKSTPRKTTFLTQLPFHWLLPHGALTKKRMGFNSGTALVQHPPPPTPWMMKKRTNRIFAAPSHQCNQSLLASPKRHIAKTPTREKGVGVRMTRTGTTEGTSTIRLLQRKRGYQNQKRTR